MTTKVVTAGDALRRLRRHLTEQNCSEHTVRAYLSDCRGFFLAMGDPLPEGIDEPARRYIVATIDHVRPATTKRRIASLRALGEATGERGVLDRFHAPSTARGEAHPLLGGMAAVRQMLATTRNREHRCFIALCGFVGARCFEARSVRPSSIDRPHMRIRLVGKGRKERFVPITDELLEILDARSTHPQWGDLPYVMLCDSAARRAWTTAGKRAGIETASHDGRMTFGTAVYNASLDLRVTQELLGHASSVTTENYTKVQADSKRNAVMGALS